jgi:protein-tyrosine phosphatase
MLELRGARMAELAALFADEELHPAVFFCVSGKDRTGLLSALVQSAIGVSDDDVADDFSLTERLMPEWHIERTLDLGSALDSSITREVVRESMRAPRELMVDALAKLRADHGDAAGYLRDHGLAQADLDRLRRALVEP